MSLSHSVIIPLMISFFFFFNDTATTEIYTLSLHDALPISTDPVGLEGSPRIGQSEHECGERDTSWVVSEELPEAGPECAAPGGRSFTAPSLQAVCDENRGQETDADGPGKERADGTRGDPFRGNEGQPGSDEGRLR